MCQGIGVKVLMSEFVTGVVTPSPSPYKHWTFCWMRCFVSIDPQELVCLILPPAHRRSVAPPQRSTPSCAPRAHPLLLPFAILSKLYCHSYPKPQLELGVGPRLAATALVNRGVGRRFASPTRAANSERAARHPSACVARSKSQGLTFKTGLLAASSGGGSV